MKGWQKKAVATIGEKAQEVETSIGNATEIYKTNSGSKFCLHCTIHAPAISSLNMFPIAHHFVPYALPNVVFLEPILVGKYIMTYMIKCLE